MATPEQSWRLEQHVGTIMQAMVIGLLAWSLKTNVDMRTEIGILQAKMENLQATVAQGTSDRYRGTDAAREFGGVWSELQRLNNRVDRLEGKNYR